MSESWERDHLCLYIFALGFSEEAGDGDGGYSILEPNVLDNPDSTVWPAVILFLFAKLDQSHALETFRNCFLEGGITDREFRNKCCMWLNNIADENKTCLPKIAPSLLISPCGPKFVHVLYQLARHVVIEDMKRNSIGTEIPFAEAVQLIQTDVYMANARHRVAYNKLLQIFQKQDFIIQEHKKEAQLLIKEIKQMKSEYAVLQAQFCKMKQSDQNKNDRTERIQKVRSMWTHLTEILTSLKKEKEVVSSVLDEDNCECILDGTNVEFSIPQLLVERDTDEFKGCAGNVYEAGALNFLTVIQLLNAALKTLRDEHCQSEVKVFEVTKKTATLANKLLKHMETKRLEIEQQCCVSSGSIFRKQEDWEMKWKSFLGLSPFNSTLHQDSELDLRASLPHSFNLEEEDDKDDLFCQDVSVLDVFDSIHEVRNEKDDGTLETMMAKSTPTPEGISSVPLELSKATESREALTEKNLHSETCKEEEKPVPPKILRNGRDESATSEMWKNAVDNVIQTEPPVKKDAFKKARDELSEEVAKTVMSESPQSSEGKEMALEDLIRSLDFNPFLTRKQILRTPEILLTEIRSSWRKAIETDHSSDRELAPAEVSIGEAPMDASPVMQNVADSKLVCSVPACPDSLSPLSEKSQLRSTEFRPQEQMRVSPIIDSPVSETSGVRESEKTEAQELKCLVLNKSSVEDAEEQTSQCVKSLNNSDTCSENNSNTEVLPSDNFQGSFMDRALCWNVSPLLNFISHETDWILDETLPEELGNIDTNQPARSESDFDDSAYVTNGSKNEGDIEKSKLSLQSPINTYELLKKTASRSEEELHQSCDGGEPLISRSDPSLAIEEKERDKLSGSLELFCLDEEFTKTLSPRPLNERKYSLSSLLLLCQHLTQMESMVHEIPLDLIHKLKGKEQLNDKLDTKDISSGQN